MGVEFHRRVMEAVVGMLLLMLGVSQGVETYCDGRLDETECYGALGGTVVFRLMENASEIIKYQLIHRDTTILTGRIYGFTVNRLKDRSVFTPNTGTYRLNNLKTEDRGNYTLSTYNSDGFGIGQQSLHFFFQVPVSSVQLKADCLSLGNKRMSCSSGEGDSPEYSWTLDGRSLTDTELFPGNNQTNSISLKVHVLGQLVCTVKNRVNNESRGIELTTCGFIFINCTSNGTQIAEWVDGATNNPCFNPTTASISAVGKETGFSSFPPSTNITSFNQTSSEERWSLNSLAILAGVLSTLFILAVGAVICIKRKNLNKPREEKEQELTYAEVTIVQRPGRQVERRPEVEVEYGQVKFSDRPEETRGLEDDRVYARVRKGR